MTANIHERRSTLKQQGRFEEAIPLQLRILDEAKKCGSRHEIANVWNYLSMLYYRARQYANAETASLESIANHDGNRPNADETLATYEMLLAHILATQNRFDDAVRYGEFAMLHYATFHDPESDYLTRMKKEVAIMVSYRDGHVEKDG